MTNDQRDEHHELREWAGAFALGSLDPDDRRTFERHVSECDRCAEEVNSFAPIPGLLAHIELTDLHEASPETTDAIGRRAVDEAQTLRTSRNRWRNAAATVAAAAMIFVSAAIVVQTFSGDEPARPVASATVTASQATATDIATSERTWGTEITVQAAGLPHRSEYQLWGVDEQGTWSVAASWGPTPSGRANITGATSIPTAALTRIVVTSTDPSDILIDSTV